MTKGKPHILSGVCPNPLCKKRLYFPEHGASVECSGCGQRHFQSGLESVEKQSQAGLIDFLLGTLFQMKNTLPKEPHKVHDLSNCQCTLLSSLMTCYGMDKASGKARLLTEMGNDSVFDCGRLCDRAFLIDPDDLDTTGYGIDRSGSSDYLEDTLNVIKSDNDGEERLVPIHADGDGHCLVHALSRAIVGWELFWHPLRVNLKQHFVNHLEKYKRLFQEFIECNEWPSIIHECDPDFVPSASETTGLRNIHIFGLANVLRRPIILLDCLEGIKSSGDYSAIFLPYFSPPSDCKNKEGVLNKPLCIAWSSQGRNHFIPLVGIKGKKCPLLSRHIIQRAWGVNDIEIDKYVDFHNGSCQIGGEKMLQIGYIQRLTKAMGDVFFFNHGIDASLVADMYLDIFKPNGLIFGVNMELLLEKTKTSVHENQLFVCLSCHHLAMSEPVEDSWFVRNGRFYLLAIFIHKTLKDGFTYNFPQHDLIAVYNASLDKLVPEKNICKPFSCPFCTNLSFRHVRADYSIAYENGDTTLTKSSVSKSGYKNFWYGKEYSAVPKSVKVVMEWKGAMMMETIPWFEDDEDPSLNSNVYQVAQDLVQLKFPGEFGSETLVHKVVEQIMYQTSDPVRSRSLPYFQQGGDQTVPISSQLPDQASASPQEGASVASASGFQSDELHRMSPREGAWTPDKASKTIVSGRQSQSIHKEELTKSKTEKEIKRRIEQNASKQQRKLSDAKSKSLTKKIPQSVSGTFGHKKESLKSSLPTSLSAPSISTSLAQSPGNDSLAAVDTSKSWPNSALTMKRVRLCMSDGRNITLELAVQCTFMELQQLIVKHTSVIPERQRIRYGFPPVELKPPPSGQDDFVISIGSGEKIMVDIIREVKSENLPVSREMPQVHGFLPNRDGQTVNSFGAGKDNEVKDAILELLIQRELSSPVRAGVNKVDETVNLLKSTAAICNRDFWVYAQRLPHLFSVNGVFYEQVARDVGLEHGKHCTIASFEQKLFVYNKYHDRLDLCLEPYGHFAVENNVEIKAPSLTPFSKCGLKAGQRPFSGQGHSLRSAASQEERMPTDIPMSPKRSEARPLNMFCDPNFHQASIEEEDEDAADEDGNTSDMGPSEGLLPHSHQLRPHELSRLFPPGAASLGSQSQTGTGRKLVRKGPGYSELSPIQETLINEKPDELHELVSSIEEAIETMGKETDKIARRVPLSLSPPGVTTSPSNSNTGFPSNSMRVSHSGFKIEDFPEGIEGSESCISFDPASENLLVSSASSDSSAPDFSFSDLTRSKYRPDIGFNPTVAPPTPYKGLISMDHPSRSIGPQKWSYSDNDNVQHMETFNEDHEPNAVAAFAGRVATDIAAMDCDPIESTAPREGSVVPPIGEGAEESKMEEGEDVAEKEEEDQPGNKR